MNNDVYFQKAIDILMDPETDTAKLMVDFAKRYPKEFCDCYEYRPWRTEASRLIQENRRVEAVKFIRAQTGMDLKSAVDVMKKIDIEIMNAEANGTE